jgi:prepilin-type processing-associated H-X9-DG protein
MPPNVFLKAGVDVQAPYYRISQDFNPTFELIYVNLLAKPGPCVAATSARVDKDIAFSDFTPGDPVVMYRLREGIERFQITDVNNSAASEQAQSSIFVMIDELGTDLRNMKSHGNHLPGGCNVLYMDGHVSFVKYPGEWPVTKAMTYVLGYYRWWDRGKTLP